MIPDEQWFEAPWRTPQQSRDLLIELDHHITIERIQELRSLCEKHVKLRKDNPLFVVCPLCKNAHGQLSNVDNLCEKHEAQTAPMRYDAKKGNKQ
jgi:hypothetical protein